MLLSIFYGENQSNKRGVVGVGWVGGIRATAVKNNPIVDKSYIAEIDEKRQQELRAELEPDIITDNWKDLVDDDNVDAIVISMTPETKRFPLVMECLEKGKHVFVEKPLAPTIKEADEALQLAKNNLKLTIGYSRRFDPRYAYMNKAERWFDWGSCNLFNITSFYTRIIRR